MKAIETVYKGYKFRSRLEARWAVFFDEIGIDWVYEPEGFEKEFDGETFRYLPDFYFPKENMWAEVKGSLSNFDARKMAMILDYGCPIPNFDNKQSGLIMLGEIPDVKHGYVLHPVVTHRKGLDKGYVYFGLEIGWFVKKELINIVSQDQLKVFNSFSTTRQSLYDLGVYTSVDGIAGDDFEFATLFDAKPLVCESTWANTGVCRAYVKAKQSRF